MVDWLGLVHIVAYIWLVALFFGCLLLKEYLGAIAVVCLFILALVTF